MIFVLPTKRHRLSQLLNKMTAADLHQIFSHRGISHVRVRIPKFKLTEKVSLIETLSEVNICSLLFFRFGRNIQFFRS